MFQVDLKATDHSGKTALHYCVENTELDISQLIIAEVRSYFYMVPFLLRGFYPK